MKKIICLLAVALMIASVAYAQKKEGITAKDLPGMKGMWTGSISFGEFDGGGSSACKLEFLNDAAPVKAKFTIDQVPAVIASQLGLQTGPNVFESDDGVLTTHKTIMWTGPAKGFLEVAKSGDKKIKVNYWFKGLKGDGTLTKK
ncbi:MAG: hypothetical protein MUP41_12020 [Desulfobacterales bacterium]|nr:hypothetical protein [Desulfobacterales bacterium]